MANPLYGQNKYDAASSKLSYNGDKSVLEISGGYSGIKNVIALDQATYAPSASETGSILVFDGTACTVTLPQAAVGLEYSFAWSATGATDAIITTQTADGLAGDLIGTTAALNTTNLTNTTSVIDSWAVTIDTLTFNGSTQGGVLGTWVNVVAVSATMWAVSGIKVCSGTMVTSAS